MDEETLRKFGTKHTVFCSPGADCRYVEGLGEFKNTEEAFLAAAKAVGNGLKDVAMATVMFGSDLIGCFLNRNGNPVPVTGTFANDEHLNMAVQAQYKFILHRTRQGSKDWAKEYLSEVGQKVGFEFDGEPHESDVYDDGFDLDMIVGWKGTGLTLSIVFEEGNPHLYATESGGSVGHPWHDEFYDIELTEAVELQEIVDEITWAFEKPRDL